VLTIRGQQVAQLGDSARAAQKERLVGYLKERYADACAKLAGGDLQAFVDASQDAANQSGRYRDQSVVPFVEALFTEKWVAPEAPPMTASHSLRPSEP